MGMEENLTPLQKEAITHTQLVKYAGAVGDFNPIHTVVPYAKEAGYGDVIAHGMLVMGFIGQAIGMWFPVEKLSTFKTRFHAITRPGEKITVIGEIINETNDKWICEAKAFNESGGVKATAKFEIEKS